MNLSTHLLSAHNKYSQIKTLSAVRTYLLGEKRKASNSGENPEAARMYDERIAKVEMSMATTSGKIQKDLRTSVKEVKEALRAEKEKQAELVEEKREERAEEKKKQEQKAQEKAKKGSGHEEAREKAGHKNEPPETGTMEKENLTEVEERSVSNSPPVQPVIYRSTHDDFGNAVSEKKSFGKSSSSGLLDVIL